MYRYEHINQAWLTRGAYRSESQLILSEDGGARPAEVLDERSQANHKVCIRGNCAEEIWVLQLLRGRGVGDLVTGGGGGEEGGGEEGGRGGGRKGGRKMKL